MEQTLLSLPTFENYSLTFNSSINVYVLKLNMKKMDVACSMCHEVIRGVPYFCNSLKKFFCHKCLVDEVCDNYRNLRNVHMRKIILSKSYPEHKDIPVMIQWNEPL